MMRTFLVPEEMTRRDAYLGVWGIAFISLALTTNVDSWSWLIVFFMSGSVAIAAAITRTPRMYVSAFTGLSFAAALRSGFHFFLTFTDEFLFLANAVMWAAVAVAQVVVAGWPLTEEEVGIRHGESVD